jgi:hypothetical protein
VQCTIGQIVDTFAILMLEHFHCHLELWVLEKLYSPRAQQCETVCIHPRFSGKRIMSVPFHMHHIIPDLLPGIFSKLTQAMKSHMYENNEAVKSYNSATVQHSRKCLL